MIFSRRTPLTNEKLYDMYEYVFRANYGEEFEDMMMALISASYEDVQSEMNSTGALCSYNCVGMFGFAHSH